MSESNNSSSQAHTAEFTRAVETYAAINAQIDAIIRQVSTEAMPMSEASVLLATKRNVKLRLLSVYGQSVAQKSTIQS